jgi:hypothetical protein
MPAVGRVTQKMVNGDIVLTDETGQTWIWPGPSDSSLMLDIDPRIDLTKPIYEQVIKWQAKDKAAAAKAKRKHQAAIA